MTSRIAQFFLFFICVASVSIFFFASSSFAQTTWFCSLSTNDTIYQDEASCRSDCKDENGSQFNCFEGDPPQVDYYCTLTNVVFDNQTQCLNACKNQSGEQFGCLIGTPPVSPDPGGVTPLPNQGIFEPLVTCGKEGPDDCTLCAAFQMVHRIIQFLFYAIMLPLVAIAFIIGGIILLTAAGNEQQITRGKSIVWNTFLGFMIAFAAWIIISTIIVNISPGIEGIKFPENQNVKWYQFPDCTQGTKPPLNFSPDAGGGGTQPPGDDDDDDTTPPPPPDSTCPSASFGPCAESNLQNTCFGNNAENASIICRAESGGVSTKPSGGDKCTGDGKVVSWGLFQINISANKIGGLDCPAAFDHPYSGSNKDCRVINEGLYLNCVRAAQNATNNIQTACAISRNGTSFNRSDAWQNTATACNIP